MIETPVQDRNGYIFRIWGKVSLKRNDVAWREGSTPNEEPSKEDSPNTRDNKWQAFETDNGAACSQSHKTVKCTGATKGWGKFVRKVGSSGRGF